MRFKFARNKLRRLYSEQDYTGGYGREIVKAFRKVMQAIDAAQDERDLRAHKSLRFEKLKGNRKHQRSLRLTDKWRLIVEIEENPNGNIVVIIGIENYHR